jgi:hypothetical protein
MMSESQTGRNARILHLSGGGDLSDEVSRQLAAADLRAESFDDPYLAMGWLAGLRPRRTEAVIIDQACLTDDVSEFPGLAVQLTSTGRVYVYGRPEAVDANGDLARSGARAVSSTEQVGAMIGELERIGARSAPREKPAAAPPVPATGDVSPGAAGPTADSTEAPTGWPEGKPDINKPATQDSASSDSSAERDTGGPFAEGLHVVEPATDEVQPEADALAHAASQDWPEPVLELVEPGDEPIAKILPDADDQEGLDEVPTPWSPSARRPERKPPSAARDLGRTDAKRTESPEEKPQEPLLTPEELEALLGRQDQA